MGRFKIGGKWLTLLSGALTIVSFFLEDQKMSRDKEEMKREIKEELRKEMVTEGK